MCVCVCVWVCMGRGDEIKGRRRGSVWEWVEGKDREAVEKEREKKKGEFLSLYPCLDFLAEPLKRAEIKILALAHQRERFRLCQCLPNWVLHGCWRQPAGFEVVMAQLQLKAFAAQNITPMLQRRAFCLCSCVSLCVCVYLYTCVHVCASWCECLWEIACVLVFLIECVMHFAFCLSVCTTCVCVCVRARVCVCVCVCVVVRKWSHPSDYG